MFVDIDALPAVTDAAAAAAPGAPLVHDATPGNVILDFHHGDTAAVAAAFARAAHVTRLEIRNSRVVVCPMEPRSAIGEYDPADGRWTLRVGCQGVFGMRATADRPAEGAGGEDPRADRQCRRLVRHEGVLLPGISGDPACRAGCWAGR